MSTYLNEQNLPGFEQLEFPEIMQDEILYSWCARFHHLAMHLDARLTSRMLFSSASAGLHHDIPCNLKAFENKTQGYLGSAEDLLQRHTSFGFYSKFLIKDYAQKIAQSLVSADSSTPRSKLGLNQNDLTFSKILKLCPECYDLQYQTKRFSWWQIGHQLPTSFVCHEHDCALKFLIVPHARGYAKSLYTPSSKLELLALSQYFDDKYYRQQLKKISRWGDAIWKSNGLQIPCEILRWCFLYQTQTRGWIGPDGKVMVHDLRNAFVHHYGELLNVFGEEYFHDLTNVNSAFYTQMIRKVSGLQYPVKLVLLINFLFDTFDEFLETYNNVTKDLLQGGDALCRAIVSKKNPIIARMKLNAGQPIDQVSSLLGMSALLVSKCADKSDAKTKILLRVIGTEREAIIKEKLQQGMEYKEIAIAAGVSVSYIKQYLAKRTSLKQERKESYHRRQVDLHREQFLTTLKNHPGASLNAIRRVPENGFHWLYANDREWLGSTLPAIWRINF
jgi:hypothetical protein